MNTTQRDIKALSEGFSKLTQQEREQRLIDMGYLTPEDLKTLQNGHSLSLELANHLIENAIGYHPLPLGVATNFVIDGRDYIIPMVVEETSVIAAVSKSAKWIRDQGQITTKTIGHLGTGQIQFPKVKNLNDAKERIAFHKEKLIQSANENVTRDLVLRGGGVKDIQIRNILRPDGHDMLILHVMVDTCDAMGANIINQVCEHLKEPLEDLLQEKVGMCILSNLSDARLTQAQVELKNIDPELGKAIAEGSLFAQLDPYRASTNNKGVLNGMDAVLIATGNDWRAVEAGVHAYAALEGKYTSITRWSYENNSLYGKIEAPIAVGTVGGVTRLHPVAQICLKMLNVTKASELSRIVAAVGLVQNLASLNALVTQGITQGHMKLHIANLAVAAGATEEEMPHLKKHLQECLKINKHITGKDVKEIIQKMRNAKDS